MLDELIEEIELLIHDLDWSDRYGIDTTKEYTKNLRALLSPRFADLELIKWAWKNNVSTRKHVDWWSWTGLNDTYFETSGDTELAAVRKLKEKVEA